MATCKGLIDSISRSREPPARTSHKLVHTLAYVGFRGRGYQMIVIAHQNKTVNNKVVVIVSSR